MAVFRFFVLYLFGRFSRMDVHSCEAGKNVYSFAHGLVDATIWTRMGTSEINECATTSDSLSMLSFSLCLLFSPMLHWFRYCSSTFMKHRADLVPIFDITARYRKMAFLWRKILKNKLQMMNNFVNGAVRGVRSFVIGVWARASASIKYFVGTKCFVLKYWDWRCVTANSI